MAHLRSIRWLPSAALLAASAVAVFLATAAPAAQRAEPRVGRFGALTPKRAAAFVDAARRRINYLPGQVLVKFRQGSPQPARERALARLRSRPTVSDLRWVGNVAVLTDPSEPDSERLARLLSADANVEYAQPNYIRKVPGWAGEVRPRAAGPLNPSRQPTDPDYPTLQWNLGLINMPGAWTINPGGSSSVIVAVIDTGVTGATATLTGNLWNGAAFQQRTMNFSKSPDLSASKLTGARDFVFFDSGSPVLDFVGHGTHVASTIAEDMNADDVVGIAYNARIMPLKACFGYWEIMLAQALDGIPGFIPTGAGGCSDEAVAEAIRYAVDNGARVINLSLSGSASSPVVRDALVNAVQRGAFISIAVGNEFEDGNPVEYPAAYGRELEGVMAVASVGKSQTRAYYSNTGYAEIAAPGGNNREGGGEDLGYVWQVTLFPNDQDPTRVAVPRFDRYTEVGYIGTSMAAPHVAGVAALLMSQGDVRNPRAIEAFLKATAKDLGTPGSDTDLGAGLLQARGALFGTGIRK